MIILKPEPIAAITAGAENLLTPSPKEVRVGIAGLDSISFDFGSAKTIDTVFLGFTNAAPAVAFSLTTNTDMIGSGGGSVQTVSPAADAISSRHILFQFQPATSRYWRIRFDTGAGPAFVSGILMAGTSFKAPHERGGGRQLIDTGAKEQLPDGSVAGEDGVVLASLKWRFVGLSDAMRRQLWALAYDRGERKPVLVIEEPDTEAAGANERIHYGTFDRFEAYERRDPNDTAWALSMTEWL